MYDTNLFLKKKKKKTTHIEPKVYPGSIKTSESRGNKKNRHMCFP